MTRQQRTTIVVLAAIFAMLMGLEVVAQAAAHRAAKIEPSSWGEFVERVDQALAARDTNRAEVAAHNAYATALGRQAWPGLVASGDAYLRIGEVTGIRTVARAKARHAYLSAFFRARSQASVEGVVRSADAFAALGDRQVAAQCLKTAERLANASHDGRSRERVAALAERMAGRVAALENVQAF